jgi:hypothetical protein
LLGNCKGKGEGRKEKVGKADDECADEEEEDADEDEAGEHATEWW